MTKHHFDTRVLHAGLTPEEWHGATQPPIFQNASYAFDTADSLSRCFAGQESKDVYTRLSNPLFDPLDKRRTRVINQGRVNGRCRAWEHSVAPPEGPWKGPRRPLECGMWEPDWT